MTNWTGTASFTYKVIDSDDDESAAAATVSITVSAGLTVSVEAGSATEGSAVTFKAKLSAAVGSDVVLGWTTGDDDTAGARQATAGTDYTAVTNGSVTITASQTEAGFSVSTTADTAVEGDETFKVTITGTTLPAGVTIGTASAVGTIKDDVGAPQLSTVAVDAQDAKMLTLTFDEDLAVLDAQAQRDLVFTFSVQGAYYQGAPVWSQSPNRVAVSGPTVTLTLGTGVLRGRPFTVGYDAKRAEHYRASLQDTDGNKVADFTRTAMRPATGPIPPVLTAAHVAGTTLTLLFDQALDADSAPAGRRFRVLCVDLTCGWIWGTGTATVSGKKVTVTLASALPGNKTANVYYAKGDDASPLRSAASGLKVTDIAAFIAPPFDATPPALVEGNVAGTSVTLYYGKTLDTDSTPATGDFTVTAASSAQTVSSVSMSETAVTLTLASAVAASQTVTVSYTAGTNPIQDLAGNDAANLANEAVTNWGPTDPGTPALAATDPAVMDGKLLTLTWDQPFDPTSVPGREAFTISSAWWPIVGVAVRGREVELSLTSGVFPCTAFTVSYARPSAGALRNGWGTQADGFSEQAVTNAQADQCDPNWLDGANTGSVILRAKRPFAQDAAPRAEWFAVAATGGPVTLTGAAFSPADPRELKLTLSRDIAADDTVTVSYRRPARERGLWDVDGKQLADVVAAPVTNEALEVRTVEEPPGAPTGVTVSAATATSLAVSWTAPVDAGAAAIAGYEVRWYAGEADPAEESAWTQVGDVGTETSATIAELAADTAYRVQVRARGEGAGPWSASGAGRTKTAPPTVEGVAVVSDPGTNQTYALGDTIRVQVTFSEAVTVRTAGTPVAGPRIAFTLGTATKHAVYASGSGTTALVFSYTVAAGDADRDGIAVAANALELNGGEIAAGDGNAATLDHAAVAASAGHQVDGVRPALESASVDGVTLTLRFNEALDTSGAAPAAGAFSVSGTEHNASAQSVAFDTKDAKRVVLALSAAVVAADTGITVDYTAPTRNPLQDAAGNEVAGFSDEPVANETPAAPPTVDAVVVVSNAGDDASYGLDDTIRVRVTFSEAVTVTGTPRLKIDLDPAAWGEQWAAYESGSGTAALRFAYAVVSGDTSTQGIAVLADTLEANGGTVKSATTQTDAALGHAGLAHDARHKVDTTAPGFAAATVSGTALTVTFDEPLDAGSAPAAHAFKATVDAPGSPWHRVILGTGEVQMSGAKVRVTLASAVLHGRPVTVAYVPRPDDDSRVRDVAGNEAGVFFAKPAVNATPAPPTVEGVAVVSGPGRGPDLCPRRHHPGAGDLQRGGDGEDGGHSGGGAAHRVHAGARRPSTRCTRRAAARRRWCSATRWPRATRTATGLRSPRTRWSSTAARSPLGTGTLRRWTTRRWRRARATRWTGCARRSRAPRSTG